MFNLKNVTSYYLGLQLFGLILAILPDDLLKIDHPLFWIFFYHLSAVFIFMLGYLLPPLKFKKNNFQYSLVVTMPFVIFSFCISLFGIIVSYLQLASFFSISEYIGLFLTNDPRVTEVRGIGAHSEDGGIGGIFKMFAYAPLAIYLITLAWKQFYCSAKPQNDTDILNLKRLNLIIMMSLILSLFKVFFWLDRLTLAAIIFANLYVFFNKSKSKKAYIIYILLFVVVIFIANILSANRLEGYNFFSFLVLYFKLGLINFDLMVKTVQGHTYGFRSIFSPLPFIFKFFGITIDIKSSFDSEWQDAQYMNSYLHQDFGYFSLLAYFLLGWLIKNADYFAHKGNRYYVSIYFMILFGLATFWVVPVVNAIEYWLMLVIAHISCKLCVKKVLIT